MGESRLADFLRTTPQTTYPELNAIRPDCTHMNPGHAALRKGRWSLAGQIYLVTFTTAERRPYFSEWKIAADGARAICEPLLWQRSQLLAWVLMPDHWHGLIALGEFDTLPTCVGRLKGRTSRLLRQRYAALGPMWAPAYHDRALRKEESLVDVARYLVMNPVRAGLVRRIGDYPFWDAVWIGSGRG